MGPQIRPTLFEKVHTKKHYGELSKFGDSVGRNKAPLWMENYFFGPAWVA
jgi:hypothetical protein